MSEPQKAEKTKEQSGEDEYFRQLIIVMSLLGGIAFAGLILVIGNPTQYKLFVLAYGHSFQPQADLAAIVGLLSSTSIFSLVGSIAGSRAIISSGTGQTIIGLFAKVCMAGAFASFMLVVPLMLVPTDLSVANELLALEIVLTLLLGLMLAFVKKR